MQKTASAGEDTYERKPAQKTVFTKEDACKGRFTKDRAYERRDRRKTVSPELLFT